MVKNGLVKDESMLIANVSNQSGKLPRTESSLKTSHSLTVKGPVVLVLEESSPPNLKEDNPIVVPLMASPIIFISIPAAGFLPPVKPTM
jgi:hypothetical protein